jgi:hypothetical protein
MTDSSKTNSADSQSSSTYFLVAFFLFNTLAFTLIICAIGFLAGLTISVWQFPLSCILSIILCYPVAAYFFGANGKHQTMKCTGLGLILMISIIFLSGFFHDISFDGQWYHQETVFHLKNKWNPARTILSIPANENTSTGKEVWCSGVDLPPQTPPSNRKPGVNLKFININHFSKGTEIIEASIYQLSNHIENGKAVNGIFLVASLFLALSFLYTINRISKVKKWMLAILLSFNPIAITQLPSFCVDGVMASSLVSIILISCLLFREANKYFLCLLGSLIALTCNIKFTSVAFMAILGGGLLIALFICKRKDQFKRVLILCIFSSIIGICLCGFHPYITNFIREGNLFYGIKETKDEIVATTPLRFQNMNRFEKLFFSLASHTDSYPANENSIDEMLKIPFTVTRNELLNANDPEVKLSAFGPFFSGALLIALLLFILAWIGYRHADFFKYILAVLSVIGITILIMPNSWWGRFVPQLWLLPVSILCMSEWQSLKKDRLLRIGLYSALALNVAWSALAIVFNLFVSSHIDYQMSQLKALNQPIIVEYCPYRSFKSNRIRFSELEISIIERPVTGSFVYNVIHSNTRFETAGPLPLLPKPLLLQWSEKIKAN